MAKSSLDYWREREEEANKNAIKDEAAYNKRIEEIYDYTERNIQRTINDFYARYASKNGITMNEAKKRVREIDMEHYEKLARKYVREHDFSQQANEEMALYNLTMKVNRLELLKAEINLELLAGYDDIEHEMQKNLLEQAMKVNARYAGILGKSAIGNQKYAHQLVNASFRGATFSERLWGRNMPDLRAHLEVELRNGLIQGLHPRELAQRFRKHYGGSVKDTERLMVTEMRRLQTSVQKESFERNGYKDYQFISAGDERVCPECAKLHGQHFKVSEMRVGENAPPMHPSCHCSVAAWSDKEKYNRWIEALANGEDVRWDEFESGEESPQSAGGIVLTEQQKLRGKMQKNHKRDGEQHQRYRKVLGDMIPDSLQSFQKMKYNNTGKWNAMKHDYRIVNSYEVNAGSMTPEEILRLDDIAFNGKKGLFTGEAKNSANIGVMEIDGHIYYANSKATKETDPAYYNFKGNKADLVLMKPDGKRVFSTKVINHDRKVDSESKLFEFASDIVSDGQHHSIKMLSERCMCESCLGVMSQFLKKHSNVVVDMVSGRKDRIEKNHNNPWKHRKYNAEKR